MSTDLDNSGQSQIACEPCRQRKRKCDRSIPVCGQCGDKPARCKYPSPNKRGIPVGYVSHLERRLAETEAALYRIVAQTGGSSTLDGQLDTEAKAYQAPQYGKKDEIMRDWERFPLESHSQVLTWYHSHASALVVDADTTTRDDPPAPPMQYQEEPPTSLNSEVGAQIQIPRFDSHALPHATSSSTVADGFSVPSSNFTSQSYAIASERSGGKADDLSRLRQDLYF